MSESPDRWIDRLVGVCMSIFVGAVALWGAFYIVSSIWPFLAVLAFVAVMIGVLYMRFRRW